MCCVTEASLACLWVPLQVHLVCGTVTRRITCNQAEYMAALHGLEVRP